MGYRYTNHKFSPARINCVLNHHNLLIVEITEGHEIYIVHKFGGSATKSLPSIENIIKILKEYPEPNFVTVSASFGITNYLLEITANPLSEDTIVKNLCYLKNFHKNLLPDNSIENKALNDELEKLRLLLFGVMYTGELTYRTRDLIISFGERFISKVIQTHLESNDFSVTLLDPEKHIITNGQFGVSQINLKETEISLKSTVEKMNKISKYQIYLIPGYFGASIDGHTTLLGRSGTDYTATAIAFSIDASKVIIWKDVPGFNSADPNLISGTRTISELSYDEAAELSHFGAKILHPKAILPVKLKSIPIEIKYLNDESITTCIGSTSLQNPNSIVKSVTQMSNLAILRVYISIGGETDGLVFKIFENIEKVKTNIISISTSQTCISLLLREEDLERTISSLQGDIQSYIDNLEYELNIALVCVVGDGLGETPGIAHRVFKAIASENVNVGMISAGASKAAYHFTVDISNIDKAVQVVHDEFFVKMGVVI